MSNTLFKTDIKLYRKASKEISNQFKKYHIRVHKKKFRTNVGRAWSSLNLVKLPFLKNVTSIYVIFHEIGHIKYNHTNKKWGHIEEMQAEIYALAQLRKLGIKQKYPLDYKKFHLDAKYYIMLNVMYDIEIGFKVCDLHSNVLKFCNLKK